jgi:hypothetical protein
LYNKTKRYGRRISQGRNKECLQRFGCNSDGKSGIVTSGPQVGVLYKSRFWMNRFSWCGLDSSGLRYRSMTDTHKNEYYSYGFVKCEDFWVAKREREREKFRERERFREREI